jgi:parvulin-like peptidyl-prolyl isomerase
MGFMQKLRQNMPAVVIFLAAMFILLIIFEWGDAKKGRAGLQTQTAIGTVNGENIDAREFEQRVQQQIEGMRAQNPDGDVDDQQIRESVWSQMVDELLIKQAADRLGIHVSDDELREVLLYDPPDFLKQSFTDSTGVFNTVLYRQFMSNVRGFLSERQYPPEKINEIEAQIVSVEDVVRRDRLRQAVESVVASSAVPSPAEVRAAFDDQKTKASGVYAYLPVTLIPDSTIKISDADTRKYYDSHKNDFLQKGSREVRFVMFPLAPSGQDSGVVNKRMRTVLEGLGKATTASAKDSLFANYVSQFGSGQYNGTKYVPLQEIAPELQAALQTAKVGDVIGPLRTEAGTILVNVADIRDSGETYVRASHILMRTNPNGNNDSVKALAAEVLKRAKGGESFASLAQQYSSDGSAQRGGDLGYFKKGAMVKPFEDAAFATPVGQITGPVESQFGYHIIKVEDKTARSFKLRDLKFDIRVSNTSKNLLRKKAQDLQAKLKAGESIDSVAARNGLQVLESGPILRSQPAGGSMKMTYFAYGGNAGDVSDVIELQDGSLAIAQISKIRKEGMMEFDDAKETIVTKLRTQKQLDALKDRATRARAQLAASDSLSKLKTIDPGFEVTPYTDVTRNASFPGVGFDFALTSSVFNLRPGVISDVVRGDRGYYVVQVANRTQPTDQEFTTERDAFTKEFITQRRQTLFQEWLTKERERAEIVDHRMSAR